MKKAVLQFIIMAGLFFGTWLLLSQINFTKHFNVNKVSKKNEQKIGDWIMENIRRTENEIDDDTTNAILDSLKSSICTPNRINGADIQVHLVKSSDINAFALPGNHLIIYTGLIQYCRNVDELCGVVGHEIGHMEHNHIMTRLIREMGFAVIMAASGDATVIRQILKLLSSSAFDRRQESEADRTSVDYMIDAGINPEALADFLERLAERQSGMPEELEWISTHPNSKERAAEIRKYAGNIKREYMQAISDDTWLLLRKKAQE